MGQAKGGQAGMERDRVIVKGDLQVEDQERMVALAVMVMREEADPADKDRGDMVHQEGQAA